MKSILDALERCDGSIHGMAHITGGGLLENVPRVLPEDVSAVIDVASWELPPVFGWLKEAGNLQPSDLASTLNTGIGMVVVCDAEAKDALTKSFESNGESVFEIGKIIKRNGSDYLIFENLDEVWG